MKTLLKLLLCLAILALSVSWWIEQPKRDTERFVRLIQGGEYEQVAQLLAPPCAIVPQADGGLQVVDAAGASARVESGLLPFRAGRASARPAADRSWSDYLRGRKSFSIAAVGFGAATPRAGAPVTLYLTVERGSVSVDAIDRLGAESSE